MSKYQYTIGKDVDLIKEQEVTFATPKLQANFILRILFLTFDVVYGKARTLPKFKVLEILARYPYWAWENGSYLRLSRLFSKSRSARSEETKSLLRIIDLGRESQDNEQWHLLLLDDIIRQKGLKTGLIRHVILPRLLGFSYYYLTRIIYFFRPVMSFRMNAAFESHAEHEYMEMAKENPEWNAESVTSKYFKYYPEQKNLNDLIRRIALDERDHMNHSLEEIDLLTR